MFGERLDAFGESAATGEVADLIFIAEQDVDVPALIIPSTPSRRSPRHRLSDNVNATLRSAA